MNRELYTLEAYRIAYTTGNKVVKESMLFNQSMFDVKLQSKSMLFNQSNV